MSLASDDAQKRREMDERIEMQAVAAQSYIPPLHDTVEHFPFIPFQNDPAKDLFLILSLKWSRGGILTWWAPDDNGYVTDIDNAGRYTRAQVEKKENYYNDDRDTRAVPVRDVYEGKVGKVRKVVEGYVANLQAPVEDA